MRRRASILLLVALLAPAACSPAPEAKEEGAWNLEKRRAWAASLRAEGLDDLAAEAYERILEEEPAASPALVAGISMTLAEIHFEGRRWERALAAVLRARLFDMTAERRRRADEIAIACLERLGRSGAADRLLDRVTALDRPEDAGAESGVVVAEIGEERITLDELEETLAAGGLLGEGAVPERRQRLELLRSLVAREVMVRRARKLGYAEDPKVRLATELAVRDVLVRKLLAEEMRERVSVDEEDLRLYWEARPEVFREPETLRVAHLLVPDRDAEAEVRAALAAGGDFAALARERSRAERTRGAGGEVEEPLVEGRAHPLFPRVQDVFAATSGVPVGGIAEEAVATADGRHLIRVLERREGRPLPFEEVREEVARRLRAEREQAALQRMIAEALESAEVTIHEDRVP